MILSLIAAVASNGVIGSKGGLPWHLPLDLKHFKTLTRGHTVIMGRGTFDSIDRKPLPHRVNIVLTRDPSYHAPGAKIAHDWPQAVKLAAQAREKREDGTEAEEEVFVVGGQWIYALALPTAARMYLTRVHAEVPGDAYFPPFDAGQWQRTSCEDHVTDEHHAFAFTFETWMRTAPGPSIRR